MRSFQILGKLVEWLSPPDTTLTPIRFYASRILEVHWISLWASGEGGLGAHEGFQFDHRNSTILYFINLIIYLFFILFFILDSYW